MPVRRSLMAISAQAQTCYVNNAFATQAVPQQTAQYNGAPMGQGMVPPGYWSVAVPLMFE